MSIESNQPGFVFPSVLRAGSFLGDVRESGLSVINSRFVGKSSCPLGLSLSQFMLQFCFIYAFSCSVSQRIKHVIFICLDRVKFLFLGPPAVFIVLVGLNHSGISCAFLMELQLWEAPSVK